MKSEWIRRQIIVQLSCMTLGHLVHVMLPLGQRELDR